MITDYWKREKPKVASLGQTPIGAPSVQSLGQTPIGAPSSQFGPGRIEWNGRHTAIVDAVAFLNEGLKAAIKASAKDAADQLLS